MMDAKNEFVEGWRIVQILGEGAFGEVRLLANKFNEMVAVKIIDKEKHAEATELIRKEACIHRMLSNPNIIRFLAHRQEPTKEYIFLEYASGGELFDRIEPDVGMPHNEAQSFMKQLLAGVSYLHTRGVTHRDLKPENLLIDHHGTLKISDFGMATMFRMKGVERFLNNRCGTVPYLAPEVLDHRPYRAQPVDIWACGIVLVAMLAGELPWDTAVSECLEFNFWLTNQYITVSPWNKLNHETLSLVKKILCFKPEQRLTIEKILSHRWMCLPISCNDEADLKDDKEDCTRKLKKQCSAKPSGGDPLAERPLVCLSQPAPRRPNLPAEEAAGLIRDRDQICFSQPTHFEDLLLGSQMQMTQSPQNHGGLQRLVKRMTRFVVKTDCEKTVEALCAALDKATYAWNLDSAGMITISTVDTRKTQLIFKANIVNMDGKMMLDFRLSKGCGLEFKRRFLQIKKSLKDVLSDEIVT